MNNTTKCYLYNNNNFVTYSYDFHLFKLNLKYLIKRLLKNINFLYQIFYFLKN